MKYFLDIEGVRNKDIVDKFPMWKQTVSRWNVGSLAPNIFQLLKLSEITGQPMEVLAKKFKKLKK